MTAFQTSRTDDRVRPLANQAEPFCAVKYVGNLLARRGRNGEWLSAYAYLHGVRALLAAPLFCQTFGDATGELVLRVLCGGDLRAEWPAEIAEFFDGT